MTMRRTAHLLPALGLLAACNGAPGDIVGTGSDSGDTTAAASASSAATTSAEPTTAESTTTEAAEITTTEAPTTESSTTESSTTETTTPGVTGPCYLPETHPWAGTLCGTPMQPCQILVEEVVDPAPVAWEHDAFRHGSPSVTHDESCAPIVSFGATSAPDDVRGVLAHRRGDGDWTQRERPLVGNATVAWDSELHRLRLIEARSTGGLVSHYTYDDDDGAFEVQPVTTNLASVAESLGNGRWHAVSIESDPEHADVSHLLRFDSGAWTDEELALGLDSVYSADLALSDTDESHLMFRALHGDAWGVFYAAPPHDAAEFVLDLQSSEYVMSGLHLAVAGATPHGLAVRSDFATGRDDLVHFTRDDDGVWTVRELASNDLANDIDCPAAVLGAPTCEFSRSRSRPEAIVASHGGDVRIFWSERLTSGTAEVTCLDPDAPCDWTTTAQETMHTLSISTPTAEGFDTTAILERELWISDVDIDGTGNIHIIGFVPEATGARIDYLLLGP
jgi:hypothetical protein